MRRSKRIILPDFFANHGASIGALAVWLTMALAFEPSASGAEQKPVRDVIEELAMDTWQVENGLPENSVTSIAQTTDGYLWVGTFNGLGRFDGLRFELFDSRTPGLESERILRLFGDGTGALWVSMEGGQLARYAEGRFTAFSKRNGWPMEPCRVITKDRAGHVLFFTGTGSLLRFEQGRFFQVLSNLPSSGPPGAMAVDAVGDGTVWVKRGDALGWAKDGEWVEYQPEQIEHSKKIGSITASRAGGIWAFAETNLLRVQGPMGKAASVAYPSFMDPNFLEEDSAGHLWIGTWGQGLVELFPGGFWRRYATPEGFPNDTLRCLFEDREGNLWVGTNGGGLVRLRRKAFQSFGRAQGLPALHPLTVAEDSGGSLWIGFLDGGLYELKGGNFSGRLPMGDRKVGATVWSSLSGRGGRLWFGTYDEGVAFMEPGTRLWRPASGGLNGQTVFAMCEDSEGILWAGTAAGLSRFDGQNCRTYTTQDGLLANEVRALATDKAGALWIGTLVGGLNRMEGGRLSGFNHANGLPHNSVRSLLADPDGSLWIGTPGGLCRLREGRFTVLTSESGLPAENIASILDDGLGYLWCGSNRGVFRVARTELNAFARGEKLRVECTAYGTSDGLLSLECAAGMPSGLRTRDGRLWFVTAKGVSVVDPRSLPRNTNPPPVVIEAALVDGKPKLGTMKSETLRVPPGPRRVEIHYTGLSLEAPERVQFKRKIEGFDEDWQAVGNERVASYEGLPPGQYRFHVIAANGDGVWNEEGASLAFVVAPPLWRTAWFRALVVLSTVAVLAGIYLRRQRLAEERRATQAAFSRRLIEQQETERQRLAAELHDSLGQNLLVIKNAAWLGADGQSKSDGAKEQFNEISELAAKAIDEVRAISHAMRPPELDSVGLSAAIRQMVKRVSESSPVQLALDTDEIDGLLAHEFEIHFYRALQEGIGNILKHSKATSARLKIKREVDEVCVTLQDNGEGFETGTASARRGMGLSSIAQRVQLMGGRFELRSQPGSGTALTIIVPCGSKV